MTKLLLPFGLIAGLLACSDGGDTDTDTNTDPTDTGADTGDTGDTPVDTTPVLESDKAADAVLLCTDGETFQLQVRADGIGYDPQLYIADTRFTKDYDEVHNMTVTESSVEDNFSIFEADLTPNANDASGLNYEDGVKTTFKCEALDPASSEFGVTFAVRVDADEGTGPADCIVFGHDANAILTDAASFGSLSIPEWLNSDNCRNTQD